MKKMLNQINGKNLTPTDVKALYDLSQMYRNYEYDYEKGLWNKIKTKKHKPIREKKYSFIRKEIIKRDGWRCSICGMTGDLEVHHIEYRSKGGSDNPDNLITLCEYCHYQIHKKETNGNLMKKRLITKGRIKK